AGEGAEWWSGETVAVVTGANRGIGLEICRQLAGKGLTVIMTARKPKELLSSSAQQFLQEAAEMGRKNVIFHTLDTTQEQSVLDFVDWLKSHDWFVDILVNNAGVANPVIDWDFVERNNIDTRTIVVHPTWTEGISEKYESAKDCVETNFYGTKRLTKALLPFLRPSSYKPRILNHLRDEELRGQLCDTMGLTEQKIDGVLAMFLDDVKSEKGMEKWPLKFPSYSISKMALNAYTTLLALELGDKACVNSASPGYVITDMTFGSGDLSPVEGAANLVHAGEGAEWWSGATVAVVTGANRGIGLEICRQLAGKGLTVIMTARKPQEQLSSSAQQFLQETAEMERKNVIFHTLDTTQEQSVLDFVDWLKSLELLVDILHEKDEELKEQLCDTMGLTEQMIDGVLAMFLDDVKSEKGMEK
ncbi:11-beta-hydroxysteroid dehydrogenase 1B, partial [Nymphaea thermarum]